MLLLAKSIVPTLSQYSSQNTYIVTDHPLLHVSYLIVKRRIAWLIGKWVGDKCASPNDVRIWQILVHLLQDKGTGTEVVRLTAAAAVRDCVDVSCGYQFCPPLVGLAEKTFSGAGL